MTQITIDRAVLEQLAEDALQINREIGKGGVAYDINNRAYPPIKRSLDALRAALANAERVGWKRVPIAPTVDMLEAMKAQNECGNMDNFNAYQAAVFAAKDTL